jgi:isopentenyl-diphosphate delta-isomerase
VTTSKHEDQVILVNEQNRELGVGGKAGVHREGALHRAFSIFIFDSQGRMLIHQRALDKYHSGGLWTNACCSHPRPGEAVEEAAHRRLQEEMGFDCELEEVFQFVYQVQLGEDLFEHEYDHVFVGTCEIEPEPDPEEVADWKWVEVEELWQDVQEHPGRYTYWFKIALERMLRTSER